MVSQGLSISCHTVSKQYSHLCDLYAYALFLRTGGNFIRMVVTVSPAVGKALRLQSGPIPASTRAYMTEWRSFVVRQHKMITGCSEKSSQAYDAKVARFLSVIHISGHDKHIKYYTNGDTVDVPALIAEVSKAVLEVVIPCLPTVPAGNKWTKLSPSLMSHFIGSESKLLVTLFEAAFADVRFNLLNAATDNGPPPPGAQEADEQRRAWKRQEGRTF